MNRLAPLQPSSLRSSSRPAPPLLLLLVSASLAASSIVLGASATDTAQPPAPASLPARPMSYPHLHMEPLERTSPGWTLVENAGDATKGHVVIERIVWPLFYLHWRPLEGEGGVGKLTASKAVKEVEKLWSGITFDKALEAKKVSLPAHDGFVVEATTWHGEWKSRYFIWACPDSGRLFIADTNASLQVGAAGELLAIMEAMTRTVRCHPGAKVEPSAWLTKKREVEQTDIVYDMPFTWFRIDGYRVQNEFGKGEFSSATHPAPTKDQGQDLVLELDALRRLYVQWEPAPDSAMTFQALAEQVHAFWKERAQNLLPMGTRVSNDVWIMDGLVQVPLPTSVPPQLRRKFRAWVWRKDGVSYMAAGEISGLRFGQRTMTEIQQISDQILEELYESIDY